MKELFRTTIRLDLDKPAEKQAADVLRRLHAEHGLSYSMLIATAVNAHYGNSCGNDRTISTSDNLRELIRAIVREEMAMIPLPLSALFQALAMNVSDSPTDAAMPMSNEPDDDDLDDAFDCFGN